MTFSQFRQASPGPDAEPKLDASARTFLRLAIMAIIWGALAFIAVILIFAPDQTRRIINPLAAISVALTSWILLRTGNTRAGIGVLAFGTFVVMAGIAAATGGVRTPVVYAVPVFIFFGGWILGSRTAIALAAVGALTYLAIAIAEDQGLLPPIPYTPAYMHWVVQATTFVIAAAAIVYLRNSHARQVEEVRALTAELAGQRAEAAAAQALKDSLNNLRCTLEATDEGIFGYDGTDPEGKLLFANNRLFELWKIPPEERAGAGRAEIAAAARKLLIDPDAGTKRIGEILSMDVTYENKVALNDGRVLFLRSIPLTEGSQVSRVWSFRDITTAEHRKAELKASRDEARRANAAKSEFLSRMSHELRTPLHAITGMTAMARRRMADPQGLAQLDKAATAADHLLALINDILDISKIEAGRLTLEQTEFALADVFEHLLNLVGQKAAEKGLTLQIEQDKDVAALRLCGDSLRLGQILLNLVGNAIKFTDQGGIRIRIRRLEDTAAAMRLRFDVQDTGIGISAENQQRLFVAFEQADGSMTRKYGGSGLGLAISKRLAQLMDGEIGVDSAVGQGSCFWFSARFGKGADSALATVPAAAQQTAKEALKSRHAGVRILLADDDPIGQEVSHCLLEDVGLSVDLAENGAVAVALARKGHYDAILMDMQMPTLNGVEATRAIRADSRNLATPIIAMTANAFDEDRQHCLDAGMDDHVGKPVVPERLYSTLLKWLDR